ncbi:beta-ketoacyl-[acyl-carrier-protein] synthase family protein [Candidatus Daviesbacteria bacterium]|nr:beta-ketoacyl-[acyl-carrier-protein] synthase family protein [Candidatus Daviesbacteria bacterium]
MSERKRRVVISGIGAVTPGGPDVASNITGLELGRSFITRLGTPHIQEVQIAGEVRGFDPSAYLTIKEQRALTRCVWLGWAAAVQSLNDSGIIDQLSNIPILDKDQLSKRPNDRNPEWLGTNYHVRRVKAEIGTAVGGSPSFLETERTTKSIFRLDISQLLGFFQERLDLRGENHVRVDACASSIIALGEAFRSVQREEADLVLAGGTEAPFCYPAFHDFNRMRSLSKRNDEPQRASRPLDRDRDGYVMSEAAFMYVVEEYEAAKRRGAPIYGEIIGYAYLPDTSSPFGANRYATRNAIEATIENSGLDIGDLDQYVFHAAGTQEGDPEEAEAYRMVCGSHISRIYGSTPKSTYGHPQGAAGAAGVFKSLMEMRNGYVYRNPNQENPMEEAQGLRLQRQTEQANLRFSIVMGIGLHGPNAGLVLASLN